MQRLAHARRLRARNELAEQDDALGVGRPLRRLLAERRVERIDERSGGRGHRGLLPCVHRRPPLERSLPPSYAPRVLAFKLDLIPGPPVASITRVSASLKSYGAAEFVRSTTAPKSGGVPEMSSTVGDPLP